MDINVTLVERLIGAQCPSFAAMPLRALSAQGWDHALFALGESYVVRLPHAACYSTQVAKEAFWLPKLAPQLTVQVPMPVMLGQPDVDFPYPWAIYRYVPGTTLDEQAGDIDDKTLALALVDFFKDLHQVPVQDMPTPSQENFYRGGSLAHYDTEYQQALLQLQGDMPTDVLKNFWDKAHQTTWSYPPVCVHGDISAGNLLYTDGALSGVIDWGLMCAGDPACDYAMAWLSLSDAARAMFFEALNCDRATQQRSLCWVLWKAAILAAGLSKTNASAYAQPKEILARYHDYLVHIQ